MINPRQRLIVAATLTVVFLYLTTHFMRNGIPTHSSTPQGIDPIAQPISPNPEVGAPARQPTNTRHPPYKPSPTSKNLPIIDNFPLAAAAHSVSEIPPIPIWNRPPTKHVPEKTPLFIGFTRNWRLLQQAVVSYITAGWPPEDIYVVENTGVMDSNKHGDLSLQNPFFLNHTRLNMLGVNVIITPTLFTFAQLQNFYIWTAIQKQYPAYFWSHMDVVAISYEDRYKGDADSKSNHYKDFDSIYTLALSELRNVTREGSRWALRLFAYDRLALVNTAAYQEVGGWDTMIPFYMGDCDMHSRLTMAGFSQEERQAGYVFDVGSSLDDLEVLYRKSGSQPASFIDLNRGDEKASEKDADKKENSLIKKSDLDSIIDNLPEWKSGGGKWEDDDINSVAFRKIMDTCDAMQRSKNDGDRGRNTWQARQAGGIGEPYYRDPEGFEIGIQMTIEHGRAVYREKWGHRDCDIVDVGLEADDAWKVEHDWDIPVKPE